MQRREPEPPVPRAAPNATKDHLYDVARRLRVPGRSTMSKGELTTAIEEAHRARRPAGDD